MTIVPTKLPYFEGTTPWATDLIGEIYHRCIGAVNDVTNTDPTRSRLIVVEGLTCPFCKETCPDFIVLASSLKVHVKF